MVYYNSADRALVVQARALVRAWAALWGLGFARDFEVHMDGPHLLVTCRLTWEAAPVYPLTAERFEKTLGEFLSACRQAAPQPFQVYEVVAYPKREGWGSNIYATLYT